MRKCSICGIIKSESEYFYRNKRAEKLHAQCKSCYIVKRREIWREHYHRHGSGYRERAVERSRRIKIRLRAQMLEYLRNKSCVECGNGDPRVLEFDHIDRKTKSFGIAGAIASMVSWEKILIEIAKCQILCANCHKIKTAKEMNWYKKAPL